MRILDDVPARWRRPPTTYRPISAGEALAGAGIGALAGLVGAAAMPLISKPEQLVTKRPNSYVPAKALARLLGLRDADREDDLRNWAMHYGSGAIAGTIRGVMAAAGLRGPWASGMHSVVRLTFDQTIENATGVGAPPWTWPRDELAIDLVGKLVYALATGAIADRLAPGNRPGQLLGYSE
jgi:hypothetical protein